MAEKIYSIKINEAYAAKSGCPICALRARLEQDETERILGAAMMEPDIRKETNAKGFCRAHLDRLSSGGNKLPLALMLSTHLESLEKDLFGGLGKRAAAYEKARKSCYLCSRMNTHTARLLDNICYLYATDEAFRALLAEQEFHCKTHTARLLETAEKTLNKKDRAALTEALLAGNRAYLNTLKEDLDWFCKKFDYRYRQEDWKNAKDSIERTVRYLR